MKRKLESFIDSIGDFDRTSDSWRLLYLVFFHIEVQGNQAISTAQIRRLYNLVNLPLPKNFGGHIKALLRKDFLLPDKNGYKLSRQAKREVEQKIGGLPELREIKSSLLDLADKISDPDEKAFLEETILCLKCQAYKATIVMTWLLCVDHLQNYIFNQKLREFNRALRADRGVRIDRIKIKDDFQDIKESKFIELCRVARIITGNQKKILDEKLGFRNTCAHPSNIKVPETKVYAFIEDLLQNVILKF